MAIDENTQISTDFGTIQNIDYVNVFGYSIQELMDLLGITRQQALKFGQKIQTYKWGKTLATDNAVGEGEVIPLSKFTLNPDKQYDAPLHKYRRVTTAETISKYGYKQAVTDADQQLLQEQQEGIKSDFYTFLAAAPTKQTASNLQQAISLGWGKTKTFFKGNVNIITLVSAMDVAKYLGDAPIQSGPSTAYGFTLLTGFLNQTVAVYDGVPEGKVYTTAANNLVLAKFDINSSDLMQAGFNFTTDQTGLVGVAHSTTLNNLTAETVAIDGAALFAEVANGVVETSIVPKA